MSMIRKEQLLLGVIFILFILFVSIVIIFSKPNLLTNKLNTSQNLPVDDPVKYLREKTVSFQAKLDWQEAEQKKQKDALATIEALLGTQSATLSKVSSKKTILALTSTKGGSFTTNSVNYSLMGMYAYINCPVRCKLWINFYTVSKNQGTPSSSQGYTNFYDIFLDGVDQSVVGQAGFPVAQMSIPVSLNALLSASSGGHTVEIRAKTDGGVLQSDTSFLQILAIED